jgi:hypothetical protein
MANKIQIKTGLNTNLPASFDTGEPAFTTDTKKLYIGTGTNKVLINPDNITGNAATATKLATARTIALTGDVTASSTFDGSGNYSAAATLASVATAGATGETANKTLAFGGTFITPQVTIDAKGRTTAATARTMTMPAAPTTVSGNAGTATKLATARSLKTKLDSTTAVTFDGSAAQDAIPVTGTLPAANGGTGVTTISGLIKGNGTSAFSVASAADIPALTLAKISDAGTAASKNTGTTSGTVPLLDSNGKLPESVIPVIAIVDVKTAASEAAMLALANLHTGDICVRSDTNTMYILQSTPASTLANWIPIETPNAVLSVNGLTGAVTVTTITGNAGTATKLATARTIRTNLASTSTASFDGSANITPGVTGTLPVANGGTGAATLTGIVKGNGTGAFTAAAVDTDYIGPNSVIDCGTF